MNNKIPVTINRNGQLATIYMPQKLCLIRHCQSLMNFLSDEANILGKPELMYIFVGNHHWDFDILLSPIGVLQSQLLNQYWNTCLNGNYKYPTCISSTYKRCIQTTKAITNNYTINHNFKEKESGELYANNLNQLNSYINNYSQVSQDKWNFNGGDSESFGSLQKRLYDTLSDLEDTNTVIVTHSDVITTIKSMFEGQEFEIFNTYICSLLQSEYPDNAEIIEYDFVAGTVQKTQIQYDQLEWKYNIGKVNDLTLSKFYAK